MIFRQNRITFILVSIFYCYSEMRNQDRRVFPARGRTSQTDESVGLSQLWDLRCSRDSAANGYAYSTIGRDQHIDAWVDFGIEEGLLSHDHRDKLDRFMNMGRGEANHWLMEKLDENARNQLDRRFQ